MDPATGTFTTMDTYGGSLSDPMSLHKYLFANSNPVRYSDPSGQFSLAEMDTAMAIDRILDSAMVSGIIYCVNANATDPEHEHHDIMGYFSAIGLGIIFGAVAIMLSSTVAGLLILAIIDSALGAVGIYNGILDILNGHSIYGIFEIISSILLIWFGWRNFTSARNAGKSGGLIHLEAERKATGEGNWDDINHEIDDFYRENKPATVNCDGLQKPVYRGGNDFTAYPKDIKYNKTTGNVKPSQGISVNVDPKSPNVINNGGAYRVETIPNGLDIIQKGKKDPGHFEIVPEFEMSFEEYQGLLNRIIYSGPY